MTTKNYKALNCPIAEALTVLGDQWTLLIIRDAMMGISSFSGFEKSLGITRRMLSRRLNEMVENGLLERVPIKANTSRSRYIPTQKTKELAVLVSSLIVWGEKWYPHAKGNRYDILETVSGSPVEPKMVTTQAEKVISIDECSFLPGPAASPK